MAGWTASLRSSIAGGLAAASCVRAARVSGSTFRRAWQAGALDVEGCLTHLAVQENVAASTQNQALAALLFLYEHVLGQPLDRIEGSGAGAQAEAASGRTDARRGRGRTGSPGWGSTPYAGQEKQELAAGCALLVRGSKLGSMSTIEQIEDAVRRLSSGELAEFRTWFAEFDGALWDRQIEEDVAAGRLDALADEALSDLREGRCTDR